MADGHAPPPPARKVRLTTLNGVHHTATVSMRRLSKRDLERGRMQHPPSENERYDRPRLRADCLPGGVNEMRPCPFVSCKHHLALDVTEKGSIKLSFPGADLASVDFDAMPHTCSLDVADEGEHTLDDVGAALRITRERTRQVIAMAAAKMMAETFETLGSSSPDEALSMLAAEHREGMRAAGGDEIHAPRVLRYREPSPAPYTRTVTDAETRLLTARFDAMTSPRTWERKR